MGLIYKRQQLNGSANGANTANFGKVNPNEYDAYPVTTSDSVDLPNGPCDAIVVTGAGNVAVQLDIGGTAVMAATTLTTVAANQILPIQVSRIRATSTTATGIFALYRW